MAATSRMGATGTPGSSPRVIVAASESYGQVIEYIQGRLYLASYAQTPNEHTPFPYTSNTTSPSKRSSKSATSFRAPKVHPPFYFTVDDELLYNRFHADFGPLHIGHLYRFAVYLHEILADQNNADRGIVFWSRPDSRSRANAACLLACYMILLQSWSPHLALAPIAQAEPPYMPFRDAGYSQADFGLSIQDIVYGVWRAKEQGLVSLGHGFKLDEYERYERVDQGDFNWLTPDFVALASPQYQPIQRIPETSPAYAALPKTREDIKKSAYPGPLKNVLSHFMKRGVGLIVRLNSELYSPTFFTAVGINHLDMIFDDGTCPPLPMVKNFIRISHEMITVKKQKVAVHCKAGLGRTGCLIGAYLIYRYGFTANEIIAFMRFMRPGMVVGPQQHWLHINQGYFREWWWEDLMKEKLAAALPSTPTKPVKRTTVNGAQTFTPPTGSQSGKRLALSEITHNDSAMNPKVLDESLPAPTPGQPRKMHRADSRHHPYARTASGALSAKGDEPEGSNAEEEWEQKVISRQRSTRKTVDGDQQQRSSSFTMTTTTTRYRQEDAGPAEASDVENWAAEGPDEIKPRHVSKNASGNSVAVSRLRNTPVRRISDGREVKNAGVRKSSGRIASSGLARSRS